MKAGAADFITKPFNFDQIQIIIKRTLEAKRLAREREYYLNLSNIDELTELNNVRYFNYILDKEIERERRYKRPLSMMMIDIDDFKSYNDTYGHLVGDVLLKQIASLIKKMTRGCDYVARYGGEEFTVVLPETIRQEALVVAERIRSAIAGASFDISGGKSITGITITIGLASFPDDGQDKLELIERADQALYRGKAQGKNRTCVYGQAEG
jgi:diguanylate cyclase (GGDEF)-like protein